MYVWVEWQSESKTAEFAHTRRCQLYGSSVNFFLFVLFRSKSSLADKIFQMPSQILIITSNLHVARGPLSFLYATHAMHVITLPSTMPPMQFPWHFHQGHLRLVYFRNHVHFLLSVQPPSCMPPMHLIQHSAGWGGTWVLFNLAFFWCISCYCTHTIYATCQRDLHVNIQHIYIFILPMSMGVSIVKGLDWSNLLNLILVSENYTKWKACTLKIYRI